MRPALTIIRLPDQNLPDINIAVHLMPFSYPTIHAAQRSMKTLEEEKEKMSDFHCRSQVLMQLMKNTRRGFVLSIKLFIYFFVVVDIE